MAWKYIFDETLDIINRGIPYSLYNGKIVKEVHLPYIREHYPERIMECDEYGVLLVTKKLKERVFASSPPVPDIVVKEIKQIEEKPVDKDIKRSEAKPIDKSMEKTHSKPKVKQPVEHLGKHKGAEKSKPEKKLDRVDKAILNIKHVAQLKPMFKEDLEDICKKLELSTDGSKGALIKKISAALDLK
jgi:hypothetical protein